MAETKQSQNDDILNVQNLEHDFSYNPKINRKKMF